VVFRGDAELVAVGIGHHPPGEAWDLVVLEVGAADLDDPGGGCLQIAYGRVEMESAATLGRLGHPLEGDREGARSLRLEPDEALGPLGDLDPQKLGPERRQTLFIGGVEHDRADSGNQIVSHDIS
jgi:hypothetical protein